MSKKPDLSPESKVQTIGMILVLLVILLMLRATKSDAQSISSSVFTEKTVMGQQIGATSGYESYNGLYLGVFYQKNVNSYSEISENGYEFSGVMLSKSILGKRDFNIAPMLRLGLSDRTKFVIVPGIMVKAKIRNHFTLKFGSSIRASEATMLLGLSMDMPTRLKNHRPRYR